jgi:hypothetical protein
MFTLKLIRQMLRNKELHLHFTVRIIKSKTVTRAVHVENMEDLRNA